MIPVAVFAHNEARGILRCLRSFAAGAPGMDLRLYVLCNGNTDGTNDIVAAYARDNPHVSLIDLALGDKANAWNVHVHEVAPEADAYVFMDGDCELLADAVPRMLGTLRASPAANAVSALPVSGRTVRHWRRQIVEQHALVGGLYALSGSFVARIRAGKLRLPPASSATTACSARWRHGTSIRGATGMRSPASQFAPTRNSAAIRCRTARSTISGGRCVGWHATAADATRCRWSTICC